MTGCLAAAQADQLATPIFGGYLLLCMSDALYTIYVGVELRREHRLMQCEAAPKPSPVLLVAATMTSFRACELGINSAKYHWFQGKSRRRRHCLVDFSPWFLRRVLEPTETNVETSIYILCPRVVYSSRAMPGLRYQAHFSRCAARVGNAHTPSTPWRPDR